MTNLLAVGSSFKTTFTDRRRVALEYQEHVVKPPTYSMHACRITLRSSA